MKRRDFFPHFVTKSKNKNRLRHPDMMLSNRDKNDETGQIFSPFSAMIVAGEFQITADDRVIKTQGSARFEAMATPLFQYKNFVFMWGGSYGKEHRCAYLLTPYLASINNLSSAVVKNTDKTMKITYTLTEETM